MNTGSDTRTPSNVSGQSILSELWENTALIAMYSLGTLLLALVWWFLGFAYVGYCIFSVILYMALICPYCRHFITRSCPAGYHRSSHFFKPKKGKNFRNQFRHTIVIVVPAWVLPPIAGVYLVVTDLSWFHVVGILLFCLVGFWILPTHARRQCKKCDNALNCPWGK